MIWAANFIVVKAANAEIPPVTFGMLRFGLAALILFGLLWWREGSVGIPAADRSRVIVLGILGFGLYQILWSTGLRSIPAGDSALLLAATPVLTALIAGTLRTDRLTVVKLLGAIVSFAGVAVVIVGGSGVALGSSLLGDLMTLGSAVCWAMYTAISTPYLARIPPLRFVAWTAAAGAIFMIPLAIAQGMAVDWGSVSAGAWLGFVYSAVLPAGISNVIVFRAIRLLGPARISAYQFLVPFFALVMGAAFLAEPILPIQILGGAVIVAGVLVARSGRRGVAGASAA